MSAEGQPSQEELQAYLEQMRQAEPAEIVAQAFQILAMGAEVKIGRPDARLLIDTLAAVTNAAAGRLPTDLSDGMKNAVQQLQMVQVQAEREEAGVEGAAADDAGAGGGDARQSPDAAAGQQPPPRQQPTRGRPQEGQPQQGKQEGGMTDRLWIPGR